MLNVEQQHVQQQQLIDQQCSYLGQQASCLACTASYNMRVCSIDSASATTTLSLDMVLTSHMKQVTSN